MRPVKRKPSQKQLHFWGFLNLLLPDFLCVLRVLRVKYSSMPNHFKIHQLLNRAELAELQDFAREPARTVDECLDWLIQRDFAVSRGAVGNWLREFLTGDRFAAANDTARAVLEAARGKDAVQLSDAATEQMAQILFEQFLGMQSMGQLATKDVINMSGALKNLITSKRHLEKLEEEIAAKQKKAIDDAAVAANSGATPQQLVALMREALFA